MTFLKYIPIGIFVMLIYACTNDANKTSEVTNETQPENIEFLSLSDIHFDPFYDANVVKKLASTPYKSWDTVFKESNDSTYGVFRVDANYNLLISALNRAKLANPDPAFVIITGDFVTHEFESLYENAFGTLNQQGLDQFITKTIKFVFYKLKSNFPNTVFYAGLGNNDAYCGDYQITPEGTFLTKLAPAWHDLVKDVVDSSAFYSSFTKGGYYSANAPGNTNHKMIVLNTIMFSPKFQDTSVYRKNYCGLISKKSAAAAAGEQLTWLSGQLQSAKANNQKVWLLYHIPPGINAYSTASSSATSCEQKITLYYDQVWNKDFIALINEYQSVITAQFGGHSHMDNFVVIKDQQGNPSNFVHITPAISPIFQNNPGFLNYQYDPGKNTLVDYDAHYFKGVEFPDQPEWELEYTFSKIYQQSEMSPKSMDRAAQLIATDTIVAQHYVNYYIVDDLPNSGINSTSWKAYFCAITSATTAEYKSCYCD